MSNDIDEIVFTNGTESMYGTEMLSHWMLCEQWGKLMGDGGACYLWWQDQKM